VKRERVGLRRWFVAATLGVVVLLDGSSPAAAEPAPEPTTTTEADSQGPAQTCSWDTTKKYVEEINRVDGKRDTGVWSATPRYDLRCSGPAPTDAAKLPELPAGCTAALSGTTWTVTCNPPKWEPLEAHPCSWVKTSGDDGDWVASLTCPDWVIPPTDEQKQPKLPKDCDRQADGTAKCSGDLPDKAELDCRDERDWWFDDHQKVYLEETPPEWFVTAVELESGRDEGQACDLARNPPHKRCTAIELDRYDPPGLLPDQCWGTFPTSLYEISWDDGSWTDVGKYKTRILGTVASVLFSLGRSAIQVVLWLLEWAFTFDVTQFSDEVSRVANVLNEQIVGSWGLVDIAWFVLIAYAGFAALRRKLGVAGGSSSSRSSSRAWQPSSSPTGTTTWTRWPMPRRWPPTTSWPWAPRRARARAPSTERRRSSNRSSASSTRSSSRRRTCTSTGERRATSCRPRRRPASSGPSRSPRPGGTGTAGPPSGWTGTARVTTPATSTPTSTATSRPNGSAAPS
jgi:hypothetical protein